MNPYIFRVATAAALISGAAVLASCAPSATEGSPPSFAVTSADVVFADGPAYPVNLIFLAGADDPIWTDLTGIELPGDASVGPGQFDVIHGEGTNGVDLGNITFDLDVPPDGISFESVGLVYADTPSPVSVDVGSWTLHTAPAAEFGTAGTDGEVLAMSGCTSADLPVPASTASVDAFRTGSADVAVKDIALHPDGKAITVEVSCSDDADFHIISPTLDYTDRKGTAASTRLAPIAIGFQDIDDADLQRIAGR